MKSSIKIEKKDAYPKYPWLWDADYGNEHFEMLLSGYDASLDSNNSLHESLSYYDSSSELKELSQHKGGVPLSETRRAMVRLIDYAPDAEIQRMLPQQMFLQIWPEIAGQIRSRTRKEKMETLYQQLKQQQCAAR